MQVELDDADLNFLRGLVRRKMRDQRNAAWNLKTKIEKSGGHYESDLQADSMDYVEDVYAKLGGDMSEVENLRDRPYPTP